MATRRLGCVLVVLAVALIDAGPASASTDTRWVTFAARVCDRYDQITANRARNNIQESLKDLGANTPYGTTLPGGRVIPNEVDPAIEVEFQPPPGCRALAGWRFKLGNGYQTKTDVGVWGALSSVTSPYDTAITTRLTTPLYDRFHKRVLFRTARRRDHDPADRRAARPDEQRGIAVAPGRRAGHPDHRRPQRLRIRRAALRHRQPQRRQRRVDRLSRGRRQPRVLLRVLREAGAQARHDHRHQATRPRQPARELPGADLPVHRQHLLPGRQQRRPLLRPQGRPQESGVGDVRSGGGHPLDLRGETRFRVPVVKPDMHVDARGRRRRQRDHRDRTQGRRGSCGRRHCQVHVRQHPPAPAGRPARAAQGDPGQRRAVRLRRGRGARPIDVQPHDRDAGRERRTRRRSGRRAGPG